MMNRGIMNRQMFADGGMVSPMEAGIGGLQAGAEAGQSLGQVMGDTAAKGVDPAVIEQMLLGAAGGAGMGDLEAAAESGDYATIINSIRGDQKPLEERYSELATMVGTEDANQTPESVLTMVQPMIMMGAADQGIGELAQGTEMMQAPVSGQMAGGIMSTVNMAPEGPAPENFRYGGPVHMAEGGVAAPVDPMAGRLGQLYKEQQGVYSTLLDPQQEAQDLQKQKDLTQAQMLFDIAQGGLALAAGQGRTFAEDLAMAASPVLTNIGTRAQTLLDAEKEAKKEKRAINLAALQSAQDLYKVEESERIKDMYGDIGDTYNVYDENNNLVIGGAPFNKMDYDKMREENPNYRLVKLKDKSSVKADWKVIRNLTTNTTFTVDANTSDGQAAIMATNAENAKNPGTYKVGTLASDTTPTAKAFKIEGEGTFLSYDGGRHYIDPKTNLPTAMPTTAIPLSDTIAAEIAKNQRIELKAKEDLIQMNIDLGLKDAKGGTRDNPTVLSKEDSGLLRNAMFAAENGTGPKARFDAAMDAVFGGFFETDMFQDTQQNRQFLKGMKILGRSALVVNPRFPVAEMETVGELFPDVDSFFTNPITEANKLVEMKNLAYLQKQRNNQELASGVLDKKVMSQLMANNNEIDRLLTMLKDVPMGEVKKFDTGKVDALRKFIKTNKDNPQTTVSPQNAVSPQKPKEKKKVIPNNLVDDYDYGASPLY